jgi:NhaP-type Na+/H+ or K+/H+ antiporter
MESWSLAVVAALILVFAAVSRRAGRSVVTPAIFFVTAGLVAGNEALGWIDLEIGHETVRLLAEVTLALVLFADAARIDFGPLRREYALPLRLLGIGLPLTILLGWMAAMAVFEELSLAEGLLLAVVLAPTDAALGQAVVTDPRLPSRIRQGLNIESGLNDGICVPLLFVAIAVAEATEGAIGDGAAVRLVVEELGYGIVGGVAAGALAALVVKVGLRRGLIDASWLQLVPVAAAGLAYGIAAPLGGSGFIAAFVGGLVFGRVLGSAGGEVMALQEHLGELATAVTFVVFGAAFVGPILTELTWEAALYAVLSLTIVRMAPVALSLVGTKARAPTTAFLGWFGPRGLASIVFAVIVVEEADIANVDAIVLAVVATIVLSVYAHGVSARPLTERYARWFEAHPQERLPPMESLAASPQRWRRPGPP